MGGVPVIRCFHSVFRPNLTKKIAGFYRGIGALAAKSGVALKLAAIPTRPRPFWASERCATAYWPDLAPRRKATGI